MTFEDARAQFPVLERFAYLNAGTNGPLSRATAEAMAAQGRIDLEQGRGGPAYFEAALALRDEVRAKLAAFVNVAPENLALATSTTNGCNMVVAGLGLGPDDEVVTTDGEHFGLLGALARRRRSASAWRGSASFRPIRRSTCCSPRSRRERASSPSRTSAG